MLAAAIRSNAEMPFATPQIHARSILYLILVTRHTPKTKTRSVYSESPDDVGGSAAGVAITWRKASRMDMNTPIQKDVRTDFNITPVNNAIFMPKSFKGPE
jgi:hypothetical protein